MKRLLSLLLCLILATACMAAAAAETDGKVDELKVGIAKAVTPRTLMSESGAYGRMNYNAFCAGTFLIKDADGVIQPNLMTDWEINEDGTEMVATFATDQGITWHDGEMLTMDDIEFTCNFSMSNGAGYMGELDHVERLSDTQLKFFFKGPKAFYEMSTMAIFQRVYPKHIWENVEDPDNYAEPEAAIGCGPYKLVNVDEDAGTLHYEAVADSYLGRELTVKSVTVRTYDSQDALAMAVRTGEVDAMYDYASPIPPTLAQSVTGVENVDNGMSKNLGNYMLLFGFKKQPTDDLAFRQATYKALDYELLAAAIGGDDGEVAGAGLIPSLSLGFDDTLPTNAQDQEEAMRILDEAGYLDVNGDGWREMPDGSEMNVVVSPQNNATRQSMYERIAEIIMKNLSEIGVQTTLDEESVRNSDFANQLRADGTYELFICYSTQGVGMFKTAYMYIIDEGPGAKWGSCLDPELLDAYHALQEAQDYDAYTDSVRALQQLNAEHIYGIGLCWDKSYYPYRTDKYEGWTDFPGWGVINNQTWYTLHTK